MSRLSPEFFKAMRDIEARQTLHGRHTAPSQNGSKTTRTEDGLVERFRAVIEAGLGDISGYNRQVLEACCVGLYAELEEAARAHEVCARCPGLQACEFTRGYRPVVVPFVDNSGFYVARAACRYTKIEQRRAEFERRSVQSGLPPRYRRCRFETFEPVRGTEMALKACQDYAERFSAETERGLYLVGGVGSGKTHLAVATVQRIIDRGYQGRFLLVPEWLREVRQAFGASPDEQRALAEAFSFPGLLIVDDLGSEKATEWVEEQLYLGINHRYTHLLPTIFTSNLGPADLEARLGQRIVSRIIEMCDGVLVDAPDYRKRKLGAGR